jgi:NAD+ synthase (glutamine-hydrolysing)
MKIALAQLNYTIGAFDENADKMIRSIQDARNQGARLVIFSELSVTGYPPLDLLEHKYFIEKTEQSVQNIIEHTKDIGVIFGSPIVNDEPKGKNLFNAAYFIFNRKILGIARKALLPTYDIFDEYRYFQPHEETEVIEFEGIRFGLTICEDLWYKQPLLTNFGKNKLYPYNPMDSMAGKHPDIIINIAASPFAYNHDEIKSAILTYNAEKYHLPVIYVNQAGAQTELIFDGGSRVVNRDGRVVRRMKNFSEDFILIDSDTSFNVPALNVNEEDDLIPKIHDALILGIKDYFGKMGFKSAVLGLSGGIDSSVTLVLAVEALGAENVRVLLMPSKYSSGHSVTDAVKLADNLGIQYDIISIKEIVEKFESSLKPVFKDLPEDIAEENVQARIRGTLLMAVSNKFGNILLNTSNKSEAAVGYGTLYGDMNGGLSVLGDVYKTDVFRLARYINRDTEVIPESVLTKPPSAELRPDQKDTDSLPDYELLDGILYRYIELRKSAGEIITDGFDEEIVNKVIRMVNINEYKRFQTPPILRVSSKAFGMGRRMPLVARY